MYCPRCGAANVETSPQCVACGTVFLLDSSAWQSAQRGYADLTARYARGEIDDAAFQSAHVNLAVRDVAGRTWLPAEDVDQPYLWSGEAWVPQAVARISPPAQDTPPAQPTYQRPPAVPPARAQQPAPGPATRDAAPPPEKRHRLRGCCLGTLIVLLVLAAAVIWISPLPEQWGLRKPAAVKAFGENPEPDRGAALELEAELSQAGIDTTGLYAYVLPYQDGRTGAALYAVLDASAGFRFPDAGDQNPVLATMANLANSSALAAAGVDRIAIDYRDGSGQQMIALTAPVSSIQAFSRGEMTREAFFQQTDAQIELTSMTEGLLP